MNTNVYLNRIKQIDSLIRLHATGTPEQLACKLNISKRTLFNYLNELREFGLPISYSKELQSYLYTTDGAFVAEFKSEYVKEKV